MLLIIVLLLLFLLILFFLISIKIKKKETFENKNNLSEKWKLRWDELKKIDINKYKKYFQPIRQNNFSNIVHQSNKIFVSIASYRDDQCIDTLKNIVEQADYPENLNVVICQQNSITDKDCVSWCTFNKHKACKSYNIERLNYTEARGPTYARWRIQQKWSGEEYFLQVDAHTRMIKH